MIFHFNIVQSGVKKLSRQIITESGINDIPNAEVLCNTITKQSICIVWINSNMLIYAISSKINPQQTNVLLKIVLRGFQSKIITDRNSSGDGNN